MIADIPWVWVVSLWASVQTLAVMYLLGNKNRWGFVVSLFNQVPWIILAFLAETYGTLLLSTAMIFVSIRGWRNWNAKSD